MFGLHKMDSIGDSKSYISHRLGEPTSLVQWHLEDLLVGKGNRESFQYTESDRFLYVMKSKTDHSAIKRWAICFGPGVIKVVVGPLHRTCLS